MSTINANVVDEPKLKDFYFERKLGSGTYATVYKAINKAKNNEVFAVKCIKRSSLNEISTENLLREIEILKNIKHDYIVQLKDFQWNGDYIYLIMEYCAGGDLSTFIRSRRTIPEKYVRRFLQQIACALKHLHSMGIAHMDLKPQNILLTSINNPSLKLADFGFAQSLKNQTGKSLRGSPLYMAPEILIHKSYDAKVDLWSVGVILFEVIFGYAPFVSNSLEELEKKILDDKPIQIPTHVMLSETCKDLLKRLLQRNPNDRISFEQFFSHPFLDLDHIPDARCFQRAKDLFEKAIDADKNNDLKFAQKCYLRGLEYLIPAIQFEKDHKKKHDLREQAKKYLNRAEQIALEKNLNISIDIDEKNFNEKQKTQSQQDLKLSQVNNTLRFNKAITQQPKRFDNTSVAVPITIVESQSCSTIKTASTVIDNERYIIDTLSKLLEHNEKAGYAIQLCDQLDQKVKDSRNLENLEKILSDYQAAIAILLGVIQAEPKGTDLSKLLKKQIDKWLSNAENIKEKLTLQEQMNELQATDSIREDDNNTSQCILQ